MSEGRECTNVLYVLYVFMYLSCVFCILNTVIEKCYFVGSECEASCDVWLLHLQKMAPARPGRKQ